MRYLSKFRLSMVLSIIALIMWTFAILQAKLESGFYGLTNSFPILFFVSLGILTVASAVLWTTRENHWELLLVQLSFLVISLFLPHLMVGGAQPIYSVAYSDLGYTEYIMRTGFINQELLWQLSWPGNYILQSIFLLFTGTNMQNFADFLPWLPVIWQFLIFFPLYIFFNNTLGKIHPNYCWAALWIFYLGNWVGLQNNGAQPFGIFCVFTLLAILSNTSIWRKNDSILGDKVIAVVILALVSVSHLLGALACLGVVTAMFVSRRLKSSNLLIIAGLFIITWSIFDANPFMEGSLPAKIKQIFQVSEAFEIGITQQLFGNAANVAVAYIRIIFSSFIIVLGVAGCILSFKQKHNIYLNTTILTLALSFIIIAIIISTGYNTEIYFRLFLFLLPCVAYFTIKLLRYRFTTIVMTAILTIVLPLSFISQHGNHQIDYLSAAYLDGNRVFYKYSVRGWVEADRPLGLAEKREQYIVPYAYRDLIIENDQVIMETRFWNKNHFEYLPHYVCISNHDRAFQSILYNQPELVDKLQTLLDLSPKTNIIFDNKDMILYVRQDSH
jgi:hypothetical protein